MKKIPVDIIESGMVLGRDVCANSGNVLIGKGSPLTPSLGKRLKNWGIYFIYIEGDEDEREDEHVEKESVHEIEAMLKHKFSDVIEDPLMRKIHEAVFAYRIQNGRPRGER